jgi:hypothetical protein
MAVVYFIQSHDAPELLVRLVERLRESATGGLVVVGHDPSRAPLARADLPEGDDIVLRLRSEPVRRGEFSCLEPYLEAATWLVDRKVDFDWLVYLSGRDYPVRPVAEIERTLAETREDGYLRSWELESPDSPWGLRRAHRRYGYRYRRLPDSLRWPLKLAKPLLRLAGSELSLVYGVHLGRPARPPLFGPDFRGHGGLQWHALRRAPVEYLVDFLRTRPDVVEAFRHTLVPDEAFVQTVLLNAGRFHFRNESRRYADTHERPGGHCRVLTEEDFAELTSGKYDFARKFDLVESGGLLRQLEIR